MTKIEIKTIWGDIIFTHEKENNTVKDTLQEAVKSGANLYGANLRGADLYGANLRGADLRGANLRDWGKLEKSTDIFIAGPLGSRDGYTTFFHTDKGIFVQCGCFRGTLEEFTTKVKETHNDNEHARNYLAIAEFVKQKYQLKPTKATDPKDMFASARLFSKLSLLMDYIAPTIRFFKKPLRIARHFVQGR